MGRKEKRLRRLLELEGPSWDVFPLPQQFKAGPPHSSIQPCLQSKAQGAGWGKWQICDPNLGVVTG